MDFEFNKQLQAQNQIDIVEIGDFGLECSNDEGYYYYMVVKTLLGTVCIATCGPVIPDVDMLPSGFKMTLDKMPYKEDKLARTISYFLNDKAKAITSATELTPEEAISQFKELKDYLKNISEESY